ncbi:hypothetical protein A2774_04770 [Candidatus Roizmanbacteria bacterium RIFCSPHIGHO2_01_FULL_39_12c]|uniref:Soluble ligand binding domain-containing protein n=1 Tax=Candidatus Roizmanbacteria bacterium RIFCSPHIGHO2_01_FULL_39_12c TaxID=1802031 RepID=A0A1F7GGF3_9BACT|nr:MAG: hypothetical protein A2774_04770 [Candidatus Roizmanbacteria bacterium RIFCSPHIGHO2_01_FULL_39_12c]OGK46242.1 MAG: hypothetical protein A2963_02125 [Candidatus Roizmanbacteria bacterium RIFCSPLOWO2_01_FULL_40_13]
MQGFIDSLRPIWEKYKIEVFLITASFIITILSGFIFIINQTANQAEIPTLTSPDSSTASLNKIYVDLAGAVEKAEVYEVSSGARLKDILIMAGGLSQDADREYFTRNFNLARVVSDQEKIYVPSIEEIQFNQFEALQQSVSTLNLPSPEALGVTSLININSSSMDELESLPGIGPVTAQKIIQGRPYQAIDDLINKKIVGKSVFEKIKELIQI